MIGSATPAELIAFALAALFSPVLPSTLHTLAALAKGSCITTNCPGLRQRSSVNILQ
jgi:hypothetical protein